MRRREQLVVDECERQRPPSGDVERHFIYVAVVWSVAATLLYGAGLPGEFLLSSRWRELFGRHSALTNPAFLTEENYVTLRCAYAPVLQGAFQLTEAGITIPIGLFQSAGVSWFGELGGEVRAAPFDPVTGQIMLSDTGGSTTSNVNSFTVLSYAINPWNRLSVGANLTWALATNFGDPVSGLGFDVGAAYRLPRHPLWGDHMFGISTVNLLAPAMSSNLFDFGNRGQYSRNLKLSWESALWDRQIEAAVDYDLKDFFASANEFAVWDTSQWRETAAKLEWALTLRVGVWLLRLFNLYYTMSFNERVVDYWSVAGGLNTPSLNNGRDLSVLYQYNLKTEGERASSHTFYLRSEVGKHREEIYARRMARLADMSPNELYNRAMTLFSQGRYWDAFFVFSRILADFPEFFKNDWVTHYRGRCEEELDMRKAATANFEAVKKTYPQSDAVPHATLGRMRICYRNNDFLCVSRLFSEMSQPNVPDSLKYHAAYLMGEAFLRQGEYQKAIQSFIVIPSNHPSYVFAQHSTAVARILSNAPREQIDIALGACLDAQVSTPSQKEIVNRSYLFFGYLFYEEGALPKAVKALRSIPSQSYYYQDALLGLGWCAIKAQQWGDCINVGKTLAQVTNKDPIKLEAALIEAYGHLMQKNYAEAFKLLENTRARAANVVEPSDDSLAIRRTSYENIRISYDQLAENAENLSFKAASPYILQQIDSLHKEQISFKNSIDDFLVFVDEFGRLKFFSRPLAKIKEDIEYAHATAQRRMAETAGAAAKQQQQIKEEQKKIEEEIQKIREQIEKKE